MMMIIVELALEIVLSARSPAHSLACKGVNDLVMGIGICIPEGSETYLVSGEEEEQELG
jgi:hypothetical protein